VKCVSILQHEFSGAGFVSCLLGRSFDAMAAFTVVGSVRLIACRQDSLPSLTGHKLRRCRRARAWSQAVERKGQRIREIVDVVVRNVGRKVCLAAGSG